MGGGGKQLHKTEDFHRNKFDGVRAVEDIKSRIDGRWSATNGPATHVAGQMERKEEKNVATKGRR